MYSFNCMIDFAAMKHPYERGVAKSTQCREQSFTPGLSIA